MRGDFGRQFVDTNILVYAHDVSAGIKHHRARTLITDLWNTGNGCISLQVLQEFYVTVCQKTRKPLGPEVAARIISSLSQWHLHVPDVEDILEAIDVHQRNRLSFWDALIICSAKRLGCDVVWTEDLNPGQSYEGIKVLNPFSEDIMEDI
ncbi:MAG TPA: PIN domain-containing protein [Firmicutes bacterium]|nr:PIN domain-containing protein [Bacillota bacterium]